jgi:Tfp pilus assembly protein PilO
MSRQSVLIWILVAVAMLGLPIHYMDAAKTTGRTQLETEQAKLGPLRRQIAQLKEREAKAGQRADALAAMKSRLIADQPFATMQAELTAAAKASGVVISAVAMEGPQPVPDLPDLVRYQVTCQVAGNRDQYLNFVERLEHHRLLIELPEVSLRLPPAPMRGVPPQVTQGLTLGFYAAAGKK